jgi:transposase
VKTAKLEITAEEAETLLARVKSAMTEDDFRIIKGLVDTHQLLQQALLEKATSIQRLLRMIFGGKTEKTTNPSANRARQAEKKPVKGHGKIGAGLYPGGKTIPVAHTCLNHCDPCPACPDGKLYRQSIPGTVVRITGGAPLTATIYAPEKLRCNICGQIFTAELPVEAGPGKYDETATATIAVLRYGSGFPLSRLAGFQASLGIPLPASTAWDVLEHGADRIHPVFSELIRQAGQGEILHNDDTSMKVLELIAENQVADDTERTGIFTTGIVARQKQRTIALFFTGRRHAGENIAKVLAARQNGLDPPIQMCDALSRNFSEEFQAILANCLVHGRRNFVELIEHFPEECNYVLETLAEVYHHEAIAMEKAMPPQERLLYHQTESGPLMEKLKEWLHRQFDERLVEPNSSLGKAINYMRKHWQELTLFLRVEKAPLDNNICERALKIAIRHRNNSLFYKTEHGAYIGDLFMSLIHTCNLAKVNPLNYLTVLQKNSTALFAQPSRWLPWNYQENLASDVA